MRKKTLVPLFVACMGALVMPAVLADTGAEIFGSKCVSCHGKNGQGTPGLAPALKGDAFVISGKLEDIEATIQDGRAGDQKKYKDIPVAMPPWHLSDADLKAVVAYIRGDLQK
ncbi:MAG TPA: c-type cytochrome [Gammaproteobacteria bacterium]|nr:c-type cytochrome [Gammaproteobacteria bacterium]